jgi:hypothetical protein
VLAMNELIKEWKEEFNCIRDQLIQKGHESSSLEYNLLACEAIRLMMCINDANELLLKLIEVKEGEP